MSTATKVPTDQVVVEGAELPAGAVMHVFERQVTLADGTSLWLRRWHEPAGDGRRVYLDGGAWCCLRGGGPRMYARPMGPTAGGGHTFEWVFAAPHPFESWEAALEAGTRAERRDVAARRRAAG